MAAMARLNRTWRWYTISFASKFKLCKTLVTSVLLYGCETWTLLADSKTRIQVFETRCTKKLLHICYLEHKTNDWVRSKINFLLGPQENLLTTVKKEKLAWFRHVTRPTTSPKPSFREPWGVSDAVVGRGNAGLTTSNSGHPCPYMNCS